MEELPLNIWSHIHAWRRVVPKHLPHLSLFLLRTAFIWPFTFSKKQLGTYCSMLKPERVRILIGIFIFAGLWHVCMNGYFDMRHQYETRFYGCKHIRLEEYEIIQDEIQKRKLLSFLFCKQLLPTPTCLQNLTPIFHRLIFGFGELEPFWVGLVVGSRRPMRWNRVTVAFTRRRQKSKFIQILVRVGYPTHPLWLRPPRWTLT